MGERDIPFLLIYGRVIINVRSATCPRCKRGTEEVCGHPERVFRAIHERWLREQDLAEKRRLATLLDEMKRNRMALDASGRWDLTELAAGTKRTLTWRQTLKNPHHTTGGDL